MTFHILVINPDFTDIFGKKTTAGVKAQTHKLFANHYTGIYQQSLTIWEFLLRIVCRVQSALYYSLIGLEVLQAFPS